MCTVSERVCHANHPELPGYQPEQPIKTLAMLDCNSMYPSTFLFKFPISDFSWVNMTIGDLLNVDVHGEWGFCIEIDLYYPRELHNEHRSLPLAPSHIEITNEYFSTFMKDNYPRLTQPEKRLCLTLHDKPNYILHILTLQLYLHLGMKAGKIHRVLKGDSQGQKPPIFFS